MGGRRWPQKPVFHDEDEDGYDVEKYDYDERSSESSHEYERTPYHSSYSNSSRETSGSYQPMLRKSSSKRRDGIYKYKLPNRRGSYLSMALLSTMVIIILCLVRASHASSKQVEMGPVEKQAPKPPPWESFPFLKRYFGGVRSLVPRDQNIPEYPYDREAVHPEINGSISARENKPFPKSVAFDPYPAYDSSFAPKQACFLDSTGAVSIPKVRYYEGVPQGLPDAVMGSSDVLGLRNDICFERYGRLGAYGYGYSTKKGGSGVGLTGEREGADDMWTEDPKVSEVDYSKIRWTDVQDWCLSKNQERFDMTAAAPEHLFQGIPSTKSAVPEERLASRNTEGSVVPSVTDETESAPPNDRRPSKHLPRTAVVIRTWWDFNYGQEDIVYLRSLITELSLLSGGEYTIHFLIHVRDDNAPIWVDRKIYDRVLENALPEEFRGMGLLWSERQMNLIYGGLEESFFHDLPVHGVYRSTFMPLQYFSHQHPEYDFLWNLEMDVRYTGQWYHLFDQLRRWAKDQPRKGLWERNGRFYIPSVHGTWEDFKQMIRVQSEMGTANPNNMWSTLKAGQGDIPGSPQGKADKPVWGPESPPDMLKGQNGPEPPTSHEKDKYSWGVGEEADLITLNPLFDPDGTTWFFTGDVTGYNTTEGLPPRRAAITTTSRLSRRLLQTMHRETGLERHTMFSEMWPASCALHHGLKAVYAPHPMYIDRDWPPQYLAGVMNGGRNGASGGARTSVYGGREHNFKGTTWFYDAGFSPNLWRRWLGYKVDNDGGEQEERAKEGRMCLPGVLLHPVKGVDMIVEGARDKKQEAEEMEAEGKTDEESLGDAEKDGEPSIEVD